MTWILLAMSLGYYNAGTLSSVEFNTREACLVARKEISKNGETATACVPKGAVNEQTPTP